MGGGGLVDALPAPYGDGAVARYEDVDGVGGFRAYREIYSSVDGASLVSVTDADSGGGIDALLGSAYDESVACGTKTSTASTAALPRVITA